MYSSSHLVGKSGATALNSFLLAHEMVLKLNSQTGYKKCNIFFIYSHSTLWQKLNLVNSGSSHSSLTVPSLPWSLSKLRGEGLTLYLEHGKRDGNRILSHQHLCRLALAPLVTGLCRSWHPPHSTPRSFQVQFYLRDVGILSGILKTLGCFLNQQGMGKFYKVFFSLYVQTFCKTMFT